MLFKMLGICCLGLTLTYCLRTMKTKGKAKRGCLALPEGHQLGPIFQKKQRRQEAFPGPMLIVIGNFLTEIFTHLLSTEVPNGLTPLGNNTASLGKLNYTHQKTNTLIYSPTHTHLHT